MPLINETTKAPLTTEEKLTQTIAEIDTITLGIITGIRDGVIAAQKKLYQNSFGLTEIQIRTAMGQAKSDELLRLQGL